MMSQDELELLSEVVQEHVERGEIREAKRILDNALWGGTLYLETKGKTENFLATFYQHLIKIVIECEYFSGGWITALNKSRLNLNKKIVRNGSINSNAVRDWIGNPEEKFELGKIKALDELDEQHPERTDLHNKIENFKAPAFWFDIENFVYNSDRIRSYVLDTMGMRKKRSTECGYEEEFNKKLKYIRYGVTHFDE